MSDTLENQITRSNHLPQTLSLNHVSPATRLLEKRRQMFEVQEALDAQKEEFSRREEAFRRREDQLRKRDLELQDSLIKFNKFLQDNESKRNRAEKRAQEKTRQRREKETTIGVLKKKLVEMQMENEELQVKVENHMKFQEYLDQVQQSVPEDYPEISDLINRHKTLSETHGDLDRSQAEHEALSEKKRQMLNSYTKEQLSKILTYNNEIARLQKKFEDAETEASRLQHEVDGTIQITAKKTLDMGMILMAVENLLQRSTCKLKLLKHTETKLSKDAMVGITNGGGGKDEGDGSTTPTAMKGQKIVRELDIISAYVIDFVDIYDKCPEDKRHVVRHTNATTHTEGGITGGVYATSSIYRDRDSRVGSVNRSSRVDASSIGRSGSTNISTVR